MKKRHETIDFKITGYELSELLTRYIKEKFNTDFDDEYIEVNFKDNVLGDCDQIDVFMTFNIKDKK